MFPPFVPRFFFIFLSLIFINITAGCITSKSVPNLYEVKQRLIHYHNSEGYHGEVKSVVASAVDHLHSYHQKEGNFAVVLDIDETSLSNWPELVKSDFCYNKADWNTWVKQAEAPAIKPTLRLFNKAKEQGVAVFFITGRKENQRQATKTNLLKVGYSGWEALIMKEVGESLSSAADFKSLARKRITQKGYHIIINMGDQKSDLAGGYSDKRFKLPNPFYYVP